MTEIEDNRSPLERFNAGEIVEVALPGGQIIVIVQKNGNDVRAGFFSLISAEEAQKQISGEGGLNKIVENVLIVIGVEQRIEKDSGVLRSVNPSKEYFEDSFKR